MDEKTMLRPIEEMLERLTVAATFGAPVKEGEVTLIPVASVAYGFGYGSGTGRQADESGTETEKSEAQGAGGGGGGMAKPMGYIRVNAEGVKYEPLFDPAKVAIAGILLSAWTVFWITKTVRAFVRK